MLIRLPNENLKLIPTNAIGIGSMLILLCFAPRYFEWEAFGLFISLYCLSGLGITLGFHRLLTHQSFKTYSWVRYFIAIMGTLAWQGSPLTWTGAHIKHHQNSDREDDPHSPTHGFWWSQFLWMIFSRQKETDAKTYAPRELLQDRGMQIIHRVHWLPQIILAILLAISGYFYGGSFSAFSWVVWGVAVRTISTFTAPSLVNSAAHKWGYRNYNTPDNSRNLWWVAIISFGEGWHNNHHGEPRSAVHGNRHWWEFDPTYWMIVIMEKFGLAWDIKKPKSEKTT